MTKLIGYARVSTKALLPVFKTGGLSRVRFYTVGTRCGSAQLVGQHHFHLCSFLARSPGCCCPQVAHTHRSALMYICDLKDALVFPPQAPPTTGSSFRSCCTQAGLLCKIASLPFRTLRASYLLRYAPCPCASFVPHWRITWRAYQTSYQRLMLCTPFFADVSSSFLLRTLSALFEHSITRFSLYLSPHLMHPISQELAK